MMKPCNGLCENVIKGLHLHLDWNRMGNLLAKSDAKICFCTSLCYALVKRALLQHVVSVPLGGCCVKTRAFKAEQNRLHIHAPCLSDKFC